MFRKAETLQSTDDEDALITVSNISKKYCRDLRRALWYGVRDIAGELTPSRSSSTGELRDGEFWALRDVSFALKRGEALAIIGKNGSGKSTLLKLLYGLIRPDEGQIRIKGRINAIIELQAGLDPVLTGRENIYVKAALYGLRRQAVESLVDEIIEFAEIEGFIDSPAQFYSSGMLSRLGFAIAAHLKPDVLLVDEVLAVGDYAFQRKCLLHLQNFVAAGGSLILVSHNPYQIQNACRRGLLLDQGRIIYSADAVETLNFYFRQDLEIKEGAGGSPVPVVPSERNPLIIDKVTLEPVRGEKVKTGAAARLTVSYRSLRPLAETYWHFSVWTGDNAICVAGSALIPAAFKQGSGQLSCTVPKLNLAAGTYLLKIAAGYDDDFSYPLALSGWQDEPSFFTVFSEPSKLTNSQLAQRQLTVLEVEW